MLCALRESSALCGFKVLIGCVELLSKIDRKGEVAASLSIERMHGSSPPIRLTSFGCAPVRITLTFVGFLDGRQNERAPLA
jgi:hypothetical protein